MIQNRQKDPVQLRLVQVPFFKSVRALAYRNWLNTLRNPMLIKGKIIQSIFIALFIGGIYFQLGQKDYTDPNTWNTLTGFLFFLTVLASTIFLVPISITFPLQKPVFFKQQDAKMYSTTQYFIARNIVQLPQLILLPIITILIYYYMANMQNSIQHLAIHYLTFVLSGFAGTSWGLIVGSLVTDAMSVPGVITLLLLPLIVFSGFFKNREEVGDWIGWIEYISPNKYGFTAFIQIQTMDRASRVDELNLDMDKWLAIGLLFVVGFVVRVIALVLLWYMRKKTQ